ncbi:MAG: hypothetical protein D3903_17360 [Candidatus Electrothrix sp. GM3_4]|nr:hypothetical protein [Candidatus Electrothrix sp. GM3_4]
MYSSDIFSREQAVQQQERAGESAQLQLLGIFSTAKRLLQAIQWKRLLVRKFTWRLLILKMEVYFFLRKGSQIKGVNPPPSTTTQKGRSRCYESGLFLISAYQKI